LAEQSSAKLSKESEVTVAEMDDFFDCLSERFPAGTEKRFEKQGALPNISTMYILAALGLGGVSWWTVYNLMKKFDKEKIMAEAAKQRAIKRRAGRMPRMYVTMEDGTPSVNAEEPKPKSVSVGPKGDTLETS
jgi:hypothetical protein